MAEELLLDGDTRDITSRGTWDNNFSARPGEIGELWVRRRFTGGFELLAADPVVVVSQDFLRRLTDADPRMVDWTESLYVGGLIHLYGHDRTVHYRIIGARPQLRIWLLRREEPPA